MFLPDKMHTHQTDKQWGAFPPGVCAVALLVSDTSISRIDTTLILTTMSPRQRNEREAMPHPGRPAPDMSFLTLQGIMAKHVEEYFLARHMMHLRYASRVSPSPYTYILTGWKHGKFLPFPSTQPTRPSHHTPSVPHHRPHGRSRSQ